MITYLRKICILSGVLAGELLAQTSQAYVVPASSIAKKDFGCVTVVCGSITNESNAIDSDPATGASISPPAAVSSTALRVGFASTVPSGATVRLLLSFSGGGLNVGLLGQTTISTYADLTGAALQSYALNTLVNVNALNSNVMTIEFPAAADFSQLELRTGGTLNVLVGSYNVSLYQATATVTPLPVELAVFGGKAIGNSVELTWQTASERNSAYFAVERAANATDGFMTVSKVAAAGSSSQPLAYRFVDAHPLALGYYRLRLVDIDGSVSYSPLLALKATPTVVVQAFPNPAGETLTVTGPEGTGFTLFDQLGQAVRTGTLTELRSYALDVRTLPAGVYVLREQATGSSVRVLKINRLE